MPTRAGPGSPGSCCAWSSPSSTRLVVCPRLLEETGRTLAYKLGYDAGPVTRFVRAVDLASEPWPDPEPPVTGLTRDRDDDYVAALILGSKPDQVVAWDKDLRAWDPGSGIAPAVTPVEALVTLRATRH